MLGGAAQQKRMRFWGHTEGFVFDVAGVCRTCMGAHFMVSTQKHTGLESMSFTKQDRDLEHREQVRRSR